MYCLQDSHRQLPGQGNCNQISPSIINDWKTAQNVRNCSQTLENKQYRTMNPRRRETNEVRKLRNIMISLKTFVNKMAVG